MPRKPRKPRIKKTNGITMECPVVKAYVSGNHSELTEEDKAELFFASCPDQNGLVEIYGNKFRLSELEELKKDFQKRMKGKK